MQVQPQVPSVAWSDRYADVPNFKNFRKVQPQREDVAYVPYADRNYAENSIDSTAFLKYVLMQQSVSVDVICMITSRNGT